MVVSPLNYVGSHPTRSSRRTTAAMTVRISTWAPTPLCSPSGGCRAKARAYGEPRLTHGVLRQANQEASRSTQAPGYSGMPSMKTTPKGKGICQPS